MTLFTPSERQLAELLSRLAVCNPFVPERLELDRKILGRDYRPILRLFQPHTRCVVSRPERQGLPE